MPLRVFVERERCQGHGSCALQCPEIFGSDAQGFARLLSDRVAPEHEAAVLRAEQACPERAIRLERV